MFEKIRKGGSYSRPQLAELWGYASFHAIARGVVTPQGKNKIILFVTEEKQAFQEQYQHKSNINISCTRALCRGRGQQIISRSSA